MEFQNYPASMVFIKAGQTEVNQQQIINQFQFGVDKQRSASIQTIIQVTNDN